MSQSEIKHNKPCFYFMFISLKICLLINFTFGITESLNKLGVFIILIVEYILIMKMRLHAKYGLWGSKYFLYYLTLCL